MPQCGVGGPTYRGVLILTAGLAFAAPARPGSVIIAGSVAIVTILLARSARAALHVMVLGAGYGAAAVLLLVIAGVWPANFPALFLRALRTPPLVDQSQLATAFLSYAMFPLDWVRAVTGSPGAGVVIALVLAGLLGVRVIAARGPNRSRALLRGSIESARVLPVLALTLVAFIGSRDPALGFLRYGSFRWGTALVTAVVGGMLLMAVHGLLHATEGQAGRTRTAGIALALLAIAAANGHGTAGSVIGLTSNATGIVAVTLVILAVHGQRDRRVRRRTITVWAASGALAAGLLLTAATPYRMVPLDEQVHAVRVLGADLLVDEATRDRFADVRSTAAAGGFRDGERLIPLTLPWSTFPPVALSAEVMPTLVPTIFGYGRSVEMGEFNLRLLDASWGDAWVLVDRDRRTGRYERFGWQVAGMEERLILGTGRMFPDDYVCVSEGEHVQLWLPITSSAGPAARACRYVPPTP